MWKDLSKEWQEALKEAWIAYCRGTIPIGCIIVNHEGEIVSRGRNRIYDKNSENPLAQTPMAHAEMTAMMELKHSEHPNVKQYKLYTTLEPCPMCFGTMVMVGIHNVFYGARDGYAGAMNLNDKSEYIKNKGIIFEAGAKELSDFILIMNTSYEYSRQHRKMEAIMDTWRAIDESAVKYGKKINEEGYFQQAIEDQREISEVYDEVLEYYLNFKGEGN